MLTEKIKIYRGSQVILEAPINEGAKGVFSLKTSDYIILPFSLPNPMHFKLGDYVDLRGLFSEGESSLLAKTYEVTEQQLPTYNEYTGGYDYNLKLDAYYWKWKNKIFKYIPKETGEETSWSLTAALDVHMTVFLRNLKSLGYNYNGEDFKVSIDDTVENKAVAMTYDNMNLLDALFSMSSEDAWNCDVWITDNVIHFGRNEFGDAVKIERNVEAGNITRNESKGEYGTRIIAFGSTRNIPTNYRPVDEQAVVNGIVQKRLMLPKGTPYIDAYEGMTDDEAVETVVVFDDVYPRRIGELSDVNTRTAEITNDDGTTETVTFYRYKDTGIIFKKEYILENETLKVEFGSGKLNGMEFEVIFNPEPKDDTRGEQLWEIVRNEDYGRPLPDDIIRPENGDKYVLSGFNIQLVSDQYIPKAEQELKEKAEKYAQKIVKDDSTFNVPLRSSWVHEDINSRLFEFGQRINLVDTAFFENGRQSRVIGFEIKLDIPWDTPTYIIGESLPYSRIGEIEDKIDSLTYKGQTYSGGGGSGVYLIRTNDSTSPTDSNVFSARRSVSEFINKKKPDRAKGRITFEDGIKFGSDEKLEIDKDGNAELLTIIVRQMLSSTRFRNGLTGEGWRLWLEDGLSKLEIDELTVRRIMHVFELIIDTIRFVGGQIAVSAAKGKIKTVEDQGSAYKITFEQANTYMVNDQMRCATFRNGNELRGYWVKISESVPGVEEGTGYVVVQKSEFGGQSIPEVGDETVLMGNTTNTKRQNLILISATEDGQPRIDILDGVHEKNFNGCLRARLGNLDGISDDWFPIDNQPHGDGLYADNAYLKGTFLLTTGEDIKTKFEIVEGKIQSSIESVSQGYLANPSFSDGLNKWSSDDVVFFLFGTKWIWANNNALSGNGGIEVVNDNGRIAALIKHGAIVQRIRDFSSHPEISTNDEGLKEPASVSLSFFYKVKKKGRLVVGFRNSLDYEQFVEYEPFSYSKELDVTDGYKQLTITGLWDGTGDFSFLFTGEIYVSMLVLSDDRIGSLTQTYKTLFEQSDRLVQISAAMFGDDKTLLEQAGLVVKPNGAGLYAFDSNGALAVVGTYTQDGSGVVLLKGDKIRLEGNITANGNTQVLEDGTLKTKNAVISGRLDGATGYFSGFIKKVPMVITPSNIYEYAYLDEDFMTYAIRFEKTGTFLKFRDFITTNDPILIHFPSIRAGVAELLDYDEVRSYIGSEIMIYNESDADFVITGNIKNDEGGSVASHSIKPGQFAVLSCKCSISEDGSEEIWWQIIKGNHKVTSTT